MILIPAAVRIFLAREPADMRRSFTGLCGLVRDGLGADPLSGHLYCFRNKRGDKLKRHKRFDLEKARRTAVAPRRV